MVPRKVSVKYKCPLYTGFTVSSSISIKSYFISHVIYRYLSVCPIFCPGVCMLTYVFTTKKLRTNVVPFHRNVAIAINLCLG